MWVYFIISLKSFISVAPHHNIFSGKPQPLNQDPLESF